jgi:hypothetical protein
VRLPTPASALPVLHRKHELREAKLFILQFGHSQSPGLIESLMLEKILVPSLCCSVNALNGNDRADDNMCEAKTMKRT